MSKMATLKKTKKGFQDQLSPNAGQKYCRMLPLEHSEILSTFIKLPFVIKIFVSSIFEWPLKTGFTVILFFCPVDRFCLSKANSVLDCSGSVARALDW